MGSFIETCHLSGLPIEEGDDCLMLPVAYSTVQDSNASCYGTDNNIHPVMPPLIGQYSGYGSIDNLSNDYLATWMKCALINPNLASKIDRSATPIVPRALFGLMHRKEHGDYQHLEFLSDTELINAAHLNEGLHPIQEIKENSELIDILTSRYLFKVRGYTVHRYHSLIIKKDFFNDLVDSHYTKLKQTLIDNINTAMTTLLVNEDDLNDKHYDSSIFSKNYISSEVLMLFNDNNSISYEFFRTIRDIRNMIINKTYADKESFEKRSQSFINDLVQYALILHIYLDVGKSFYPRVPVRDDIKLKNFTKTLQKHLKNL